jgi:hypothetical protein
MPKRTRHDVSMAEARLAVAAAILACVAGAFSALAAWFQLVATSWPR